MKPFLTIFADFLFQILVVNQFLPQFLNTYDTIYVVQCRFPERLFPEIRKTTFPQTTLRSG
jgi:aspartokinase-like uncharacterized kinase